MDQGTTELGEVNEWGRWGIELEGAGVTVCLTWEATGLWFCSDGEVNH